MENLNIIGNMGLISDDVYNDDLFVIGSLLDKSDEAKREQVTF